MQVTLLGTGCPVAHPRRGGAATLIEAGGSAVLVDCGSMATQRLVEAGVPGAHIDALLVTHLHSDHLIDLYQLVVSGWHQGRARPLRVVCPAPVVPVIEAIMAAWADERALRVAFEKRPSAVGLELEIDVLEPDRPVIVGDLEVRPILVDHAPVEPAFGFVFDSGGQRAVISGDTRRSEALIEAGRGCGLLVHEVFLHREMRPLPGTRDPATIEAVASYHTLSSEVGAVAAAMEAGALALTHFVPPDFDRARLLAEVAESYEGPVIVGEDLTAIDLFAGTVRWRDFHARLG